MGRDRLPNSRVGKRKVKITWHHADDDVRPVVHEETLPQSLLRASELLLPQLVTQHRQSLAAALLLPCKDTAKQRLDAKQRPEIRRHTRRAHSFPRVARAKQECLRNKLGHVLETAVPRLPIGEVK